jgi:hypothetical protein
MASKKQQVRAAFRDAVFKRDGYKCVVCGLTAPKTDPESVLDAHHINNRNTFPNGGYVKENGVSLCKHDKPNGEKSCHLKAEECLEYGAEHPNCKPEELYAKIGSNREKADAADARLK